LHARADASAPVKAVAIMGATATGKSRLAIELAKAFDGEVISMDSRQVYRGLDVGTGKVDAAARAQVRHHLIDILDPTEPVSAGVHAALADACVRDIAARGRTPILAGGTGLYFRALFGGLVAVSIPRERLLSIRQSFAGRDTATLHAELTARDPARAREVFPNDRIRITRALELIAYTGVSASDLYRRQQTRGVTGTGVVYLKIVLTMPREMLRARVAARTRELFDAGWPREVAGLLERGVPVDAPAMKSLGYAELAAALRAGEAPEKRFERIVTATRQYAKRQETFFRSERDAVWIDATRASASGEAARLVAAFLGRGGPQ
jgi:tRNA dimethylallyltransferase